MLRRAFTTSACSFKIRQVVKNQLEVVLHDLDEYKKFAKRQEELEKSRRSPTFDDKELKLHMNRRIAQYLGARPKFIGKRPATFRINHPLVYKQLGITREDLESKYKIGIIVEKFLQKDEVAKAFTVCILAQAEKATPAMNKILSWMVTTKRQSIARSLRSALKKRGIPTDLYTFAAMLPDRSKITPQEDKGKTKIAIREFHEAVEKSKPEHVTARIYALNRLMKFLTGTALSHQLMTFWNSVVTERDAITYTTLLNGLGRRAKCELDVSEGFVSQVFQQAEKDKNVKMDAQLLNAFAYARIYADAKHLGEKEAAKQVVELYRNKFDVEYFIGKSSTKNQSKYEMNPAAADIYFQALLQGGNERECVEHFNLVLKAHPMKLELQHFYTYFEIVSRNKWVNDLRPAMDKLFGEKPAYGLPSAETTGMILTTYEGLPPEEVSLKKLYGIVQRHQNIWQSRLIFVDILLPFMKHVLRIIESVKDKSSVDWKKRLRLDRTYSFMIKGLHTLTMNMIDKHCVPKCIESLEVFIKIFEYFTTDCGMRNCMPMAKQFLRAVRSLRDEIGSQRKFKADPVLKLQEEIIPWMNDLGIRQSNRYLDALSKESELTVLRKVQKRRIRQGSAQIALHRKEYGSSSKKKKSQKKHENEQRDMRNQQAISSDNESGLEHERNDHDWSNGNEKADFDEDSVQNDYEHESESRN